MPAAAGRCVPAPLPSWGNARAAFCRGCVLGASKTACSCSSTKSRHARRKCGLSSNLTALITSDSLAATADLRGRHEEDRRSRVRSRSSGERSRLSTHQIWTARQPNVPNHLGLCVNQAPAPTPAPVAAEEPDLYTDLEAMCGGGAGESAALRTIRIDSGH